MAGRNGKQRPVSMSEPNLATLSHYFCKSTLWTLLATVQRRSCRLLHSVTSARRQRTSWTILQETARNISFQPQMEGYKTFQYPVCYCERGRDTLTGFYLACPCILQTRFFGRLCDVNGSMTQKLIGRSLCWLQMRHFILPYSWPDLKCKGSTCYSGAVSPVVPRSRAQTSLAREVGSDDWQSYNTYMEGRRSDSQ